MKQTPVIALLFLSSQAMAAGGMTIQNLPNEPEQPNPVCRDNNGTLANCTPSAGVDPIYLSPVAVDRDGDVLGTVIESDKFFSGKNYSFRVSLSSGEVRDYAQIYFDEKNCLGNAYVVHAIQGNAFRSPIAPKAVYYAPRGAEPQSIQILSWYYGYDVPYGCSNWNTTESLIPAYPNDPAITGVLNKGTETNPYTLPITLQRP